MPNKVAKLTLPGSDQEIELPIRSGTFGQEVIDISQLSKHGLFTFDPGFVSTAACESKITYIDGANGVLLYRGYPIEQLTEKTDFLDVCYLLYHGELPNQQQKNQYVALINSHTLVHEQILHFFNGFRRDAHPMAIMCGVVGALSAFYHEDMDLKNAQDRYVAAMRLVAKMPTIAAMCYKYSSGLPFIYPQDKLNYAENFLHMMFATPAQSYQPNPVLVSAMDKIFTLHADHEQNASTSTVRLAGSTGANPFACISAGIAALWGPLHGGANEAVLAMLHAIGDVTNIDKFVARAKDRSDPFRLMGFGHRVYKNYDPRAKVMQKTCYQVLNELNAHNDPMLRIALKLEEIALKDEYFITRKLYPNVDFYSGITLKAIGIPTNMFTVIFALARTIGWVSHWNEMVADPNNRIGRPRQLFTGVTQRDV